MFVIYWRNSNALLLSLNIFFIRDMPELLKNEYTDKKK